MALYTKETALYDTGKIGTDINNAGKTATSYLSVISGTSGISVHDAGDTDNFANLSSDGMKVYKSGDKVAEFGNRVKLGDDVNRTETYPGGLSTYFIHPSRPAMELEVVHNEFEDAEIAGNIVPFLSLTSFDLDDNTDIIDGSTKTALITPTTLYAPDATLTCDNVGKTFTTNASNVNVSANVDSYTSGPSILLPPMGVYVVVAFATFPSNSAEGSRRVQIYDVSHSSSIKTESQWGKNYMAITTMDIISTDMNSPGTTIRVRVSSGVAINGVSTSIKAVRII